VDDFANRLAKRDRHLAKWARREGVEAYRVYDRDIPEHPFAVDRYGDAAVLYVYDRPILEKREDRDSYLAAAVAATAEALGVGRKSIYLKERSRQKGHAQYEKLAHRRREIVLGEGGLRFICNLSDYLDTGLFLDHRPTRALVRDMARDRRVLNLFAYTGSFSVAAAAGGAKRVESVDLSNTYLAWAQRNAELNDLRLPDDACIRADALAFVKQAEAGKRRYDFVILDPPTFSTSKGMVGTFDVQRDHAWLIGLCLRLLTDEGVLLFSTNRQGFRLETEPLGKISVEDITRKTTPPDFARRPPHRAFLMRG